MPRVLHIVDSLERTGRARQVLVLSGQLRARGFEVHVAAVRGPAAMQAEFDAAGISTHRLKRRWLADPIAFGRIKRLMRRLRPDVVHTWDATSAYFGWAAARMARSPHRLVTSYRAIEPWKVRWQWAVERRLAVRSDWLVAPSVHIRTWCVANGLPAEKLVVIPPGVPSAPRSDISREGLLRELQLPADARLIGVIGRQVPEKRVKDLIWAADLLRVLHDNLRVLIIGDGPERQRLEQYARMASDLDHIRFLGERSDVWRILPHLDVLWNSDEPRGHALAILEAMAAGVPVIASDTPFNRELVVEDETGYLIPLNERAGRAARARHTDRIFTDSALAARLGAASRARVHEAFCVETAAQRMIALYEADAEDRPALARSSV